VICALQQEAGTVNSSIIVIKKYANRRLYDTSTSRYINLEDIAAMVRNGKEVQVVDAATGEDLTRVTLTQIIVEDAKEQPSGLPLELLRQLIVASDRVGQEFIMWYLKSAFDAYQNVQSSLQSRLSQMQSAAMSPLQMVKSFLQSNGGEKTSEPSNEVEELRRRLAELEKQQTRPAAPRKSVTKSAPKKRSEPRTGAKRKR
jgi:polyhydroxyalkanoate synthesis repressor PhaR